MAGKAPAMQFQTAGFRNKTNVFREMNNPVHSLHSSVTMLVLAPRRQLTSGVVWGAGELRAPAAGGVGRAD